MERLTDKAEFARACERAGIGTPRTITVSFSNVEDEAWAAPRAPFSFPVVAKAANGEPYTCWSSRASARSGSSIPPRNSRSCGTPSGMLASATRSSFKSSFWGQHRDAFHHGVRGFAREVTLIGSARVLLEDHADHDRQSRRHDHRGVSVPMGKRLHAAHGHGYRGFANLREDSIRATGALSSSKSTRVSDVTTGTWLPGSESDDSDGR